jgi:FkbM family methyltransferase
MRFIKDHLIRPGDIVFECGGHHGCTAIVLSKWVGDFGKVMTFEALPANCDIIEKNINLNNIHNIILERKAVGNERGKIAIENASDSSVSVSGEGLEVELTCLDEYEHLKPTFLKIDVEGFEMQVLLGAKKILSSRPKLDIEIHTEQLAKYGTSVQDLINLVLSENYKVWIQWDDNQQPIEFDIKTPILKRVHLFGIPCVNGYV